MLTPESFFRLAATCMLPGSVQRTIVKNRLQPGKNFFQQVASNSFNKTAAASRHVKGSRLTAHHHALRLTASAHQRNGKACIAGLLTALCDRTNDAQAQTVELFCGHDENRSWSLLLAADCRIEIDEPDFAA